MKRVTTGTVLMWERQVAVVEDKFNITMGNIRVLSS